MMCLNELTLRAIDRISLHMNETLAIVDGEQHLILGVGCKCAPMIDVDIVDLDLEIVWVEGIDE